MQPTNNPANLKKADSIEMTERAILSAARPQSEPVQLSGVWQMSSTAEADQILGGKQRGYVYRRDGHPNATSLASKLQAMHHAEEAIVTAQGMSAISIAALALLKPGDRVLLGQPLYGRTSFMLKNDMSRWGITCEDVLSNNLSHWRDALKTPARMVIIETITNPRLSVPDISAISELAHQSGGLPNSDSGTIVLVDNTFATPALCQPLRFGADLVMESLSKFVCGHGDAMLGLLCGKSVLWDRIRQTMSSFGMTSSPLDCWLTSRGLASLNVRMNHASNTARALATAINSHPALISIDYPGLLTHQDHSVALSQFGDSFGNMLTLHLKGEGIAAQRFIELVAHRIPFCPSLGEAETTLSHPVSTSHRSYSQEQLRGLGIDGGTIRLSIGLEPSEQVLETVRTTLDQMS